MPRSGQGRRVRTTMARRRLWWNVSPLTWSPSVTGSGSTGWWWSMWPPPSPRCPTGSASAAGRSCGPPSPTAPWRCRPARCTRVPPRTRVRRSWISRHPPERDCRRWTSWPVNGACPTREATARPARRWCGRCSRRCSPTARCGCARGPARTCWAVGMAPGWPIRPRRQARSAPNRACSGTPSAIRWRARSTSTRCRRWASGKPPGTT